MLVTTAYHSHRPTAADHVRAVAAAERARAENPPIEQQRADCRTAQQQAGGGANYSCDQIRAPQPDEFLSVSTFRFASDTRPRLVALSVALALLGFVVGASAIGAEWSAGTLQALLTWEPRRAASCAARRPRRSTTAALGVALVYFVGGELGLRAIWNHGPWWVASTNVAAWLDNGADIYTDHCAPDGSCTGTLHTVTLVHGAVLLGGVVAVLVVAHALLFRRRDVL